MEQPNGNPCPECGAPRHRDHTPSCTCTLRASDALRDARTAQAAAAEDFDPLRIRPYVELDGGAADSAPDTPGGAPDGGRDTGRAPGSRGAQDAPAASGAPRAADATVQLRAVTPQAPGPADPSGARAPSDAPAPTGTPAGPSDAPGAGNPTSVLPTPLAPPTTEPSATDLDLFETGHPSPSQAAPAGDDTVGRAAAPPRRRRRTGLLAVAGAVVAVVGAAGWASGLFSYETPSRDGAPPEDIRAGVPDPSSAPLSATPTTGASSAAPTSVSSPSASASASASPSASPSPSATSATPSPSESAEPSSTPTTPAPTVATEGTEEDGPEAAAPVLGRGDRGPEVTELQLRLRQLHLYNGDVNGQFNRRVEDSLRAYQWARGLQDELGVYGPRTRARLESETREP
ncbi:peptidoglycan-binding domain-containing protein [Streptomyces viridosporus]|uniref:peptidoglycan-binding domain-containing protein n=1 Tax=Streptomyces viridosporus TaxID=67581 RepID=UPI001CC77492|nr:peptidoglycan-binding protein [Streptomyces viridosporus]